MTKKKWFYYLLLVLMARIHYGPALALAQEDEKIPEIKKTVVSFIEAFESLNIDAVMKIVSADYKSVGPNGTIDRDKFRVNSEKILNRISGTYVDYIYSDLEILKSSIQDKKANLVIQFNESRFNLSACKKEIIKKTKFVTLVKENNIWKIVRWKQYDNDSLSFE